MGSNFIIVFLVSFGLIIEGLAQSPVSSFSVNDPVCLEESIDLTNASTDVDTYEWDFCALDFQSAPTINTLSTISGVLTSVAIETIEEGGKWYGFVTSRFNDKLFRIDYGDSPLNTPSNIEDLGSISGLSRPDEMYLLKESGTWYMFVTNDNSPYNLIRLAFDSGIENAPTATNLGNFSSSLNRPRGLSINHDGSDYIAVLSNLGDNTITLLNLGPSLTVNAEDVTVITTSAIAGANGIIDMTVVQEDDQWYGFTVSSGNNIVHRVEFGSTLYSTPSTITDFAPSGATGPSTIDVVRESGKWYIFLGRADSGYTTRLFELDDINGAFSPSEIAIVGAQVLSGLDIDEYQGGHVLSAVNTSGTIYSYEFNTSCIASSYMSSEELPNGINYSSSGSFIIGLEVENTMDKDYSTAAINVSGDTAPSSTFSINANRCISNVSSFTATTAGLNYSWDFDDDGIEDSNLENPTFQFLSEGNRTVRLTVDDGTCDNFYEETFLFYQEPASLNFEASNLCSNAEVVFNNLSDETGITEAVPYEWDFDGESTSTLKNPTYVFTTAGFKTITLRTTIAGCEAMYQEVIEIQSGPSTSFSYTNNCFGESIVFTDESIGGVSNSWDFGDGSSVQNDVSNPSHEYASVGTYTVTLTVTNAGGCVSNFSQDIEVTDDPLADFTFGSAEENLPVSFTAEDLTKADDAVTDWLWDFDGLGSSNQIAPSFTFAEPGDKTISLTVTTSQGCSEVIEKTVSVEESVCPTISYTLSSASFCIDENINIINTTTNASSFSWDFCSELSGNITEEVARTFTASQPLSATYINDGLEWYGFITDRSGNQLLRFDFGTSLYNSPSIVDLGSLDDNLNLPDKIRIIQEGSDWYGLILNAGDNSMVRLGFGSDLKSEPGTGLNIVHIANPHDALSAPRGLEIITQNDSIYAVITNQGDNSIVTFNYFNSITNDLDPEDVNKTVLSGTDVISDVSLLKNCGEVIALTTSFETDEVIKVDYGNDLGSNPVVSTIDVTGLTNPRRIAHANDGISWKVFVLDNDDGMYRLDFNDGINSTPSQDKITVTSGLSGLEFPLDSLGFAINFSTNELLRLNFEVDCPASIRSSSEFEPNALNYPAAGDYTISLIATHENGNETMESFTVTVGSDVSPSAAFLVDDSRCISNSNVFTPQVTDLTLYSWDFNNDGIEDSNQEAPTFDFSSLGAGTYTVRLDVNDGTCDNFHEELITIYEAPPTPTFDITGDLCLNNEISLINTTDEDGYNDQLTYQWIIDGTISTQRDTTFTFLTEGFKDISLQAFIPGCESTVTQQSITINVGPGVAFSYTNNCFGEEVQFTADLTGDGITDYEWDFGDGTSTVSNIPNPTHQFTLAGDYTVSLSAMNDQGCENTFETVITVNDQPLVDFSIDSDLIENLPVTFNGEDLTTSDDFISSWLWDFDGLGSSTDQNPSFIFTAPAMYQVTLSIATNQGCSEIIQQSINVREAQYPSPSFISNEVCQHEQIVLTNTSVNATTYEWDFCNELNGDASIQTLIGIGGNLPLSATYAEDSGLWYGFITDRSSGVITRLDFGSDPLNDTPVITNLGNLDGILNLADKIRLYKENDTWYGFILNSGNSEMLRIVIGNSLSTSPSLWIVESLGSIDGNLSQPRGLELFDYEGNLYAVVSNQGDNSIVVLNFRESVLNGLSTDDVNKTIITDADGTFDVSIIESAGEVEVFTASFDSDEIFRLSYGGSLMATPSVSNLNVLGLSGPRRIAQYNDGQSWKLFVLDDLGAMYRLDFSNGVTQDPVTDKVDLVDNLTGFEFVNDSTAFLLNSTDRELVRLSFKPNCPVSIKTSNLETPLGLSYFMSGNYQIALNSKNELGRNATFRSFIDVNGSVATPISFGMDESRCVSNMNLFSPSISGLSSYSWDFNGDGIEDSDEENPSFDYGALGTGTYSIRLGVDDGSCNNFYEEEITIYDPPPAPSYTVTSTLYCLNTDVIFSNTTSDATYDGPLTYLWEFVDDETGAVQGSSTEKDASFAFTSSGNKTIRLTSSIPGCEEITEQTITINSGPTADFFAPTVCQNEAMQFTNTSTSGVSYLWDFGDGVTSTNENPSHVYTVAGNYSVQLTTTDALGCDASQVIEVAVSALPAVDFDFTVACNSLEGVEFIDQTTIENADVIAWSWSVDGSEVSTIQNPILSFPDGGTRNVSLVVTGSNGCTATYNEDIEILVAPVPDFTIDMGCQGGATVLNDASISSGNPVVSWLWDVNGESYTTNDVEHIFADPGTYEVTLEVTAQNFCSESITKTVEILQLPEVNFSIQGGCDNEVILTEDLSTQFVDPINVRRWMLDGANVGSGSQLFLQNLAAGTYDIVLEVETEAGCVTSSSQPLIINGAPDADFTFDRNYGIPGDQIGFTNTSIGGTSFQWLLDGEEFSTSAITQNFIFEEPGTYLVSLVSQNDLGCSDTTRQEILIAVPEVDLRIGTFDLIQEGNIGKIFFEIENQSNLPVEKIEATIELENQLSVTEEINQLIGIGETVRVGLDVGIPLTVSQTSYFCVTLASQYSGYDDVDPLNNEKCLTVEPQITVEDPYPNPVTDQFRVRVVVPEEQSVNVTLINSAGKIETEQSFAGDIGLNSYFIDMSALNPGIYFVNIEVGNQTFRRKVIKF